MRWSQTGYISEHMPIHLRGPAIGFSTTLSGLSSTVFAYVMREVQSPGTPDFSSSFPFFIGGSIGVLGALLLLISDKTLLKVAPPPDQTSDVVVATEVERQSSGRSQIESHPDKTL